MSEHVAELARCRAALAASEARFRAVIERNADGVVLLDGAGIMLYVNSAAERLLNRPAAECVGSVFPYPAVPDAVSEVDLSEAGGGGVVAEVRVAETEWEGAPARLATLRDLTDRNASAAALRSQTEALGRQAEALAEADRAKDEFLAMLAHELRNPLAEVTYAVRLMRADGSDGCGEATREAAERQLRHLARVVDNLLDAARITRGVIDLRREPVDVRTAARRVIEGFAPAAEKRGQSLSLAVADRPLVVEADVMRLEQVIASLVDNALRFGRHGGRVEVSVAGEDGAATVRVRDDGVGIAPDVLPHVFDLFRQGDRSPARARGGLGVGLTLAHRLVERHGGRVTAASAGDGLGSEFVVRLPLRRTPPADGLAADGLAADGLAAGRAADPAAGRVRPLRILLVEDQVSMARMLAILLTRRGHEVHVAHDGPAALERASAVGPELILLDVGLPGMDGYEVARRLRGQSDAAGRLIVALTGYGREEDRRRCLDAGCDRHLVKPVSFAALDEIFTEIERLAAGDAPG